MSRYHILISTCLVLPILLLSLGGCGENPVPVRTGQSIAVGSISITAEPTELNAEWILDGPDDYHEKGSGNAIHNDLATGGYTLNWSGRSGWNRPDPAIIRMTLAEADTISFTGMYTERSFVPASVLIPAGQARIGSLESEVDRGVDELRHRLNLSRAFRIRNTEITQAEYLALAASNPSFFNDCPDCPVEHLSWQDAIMFCNTLSVADGLDTAYVWNSELSGWQWDLGASGWRLPTEAEWEYACRAGVMDPFNSGACLDADSNANFAGDSTYADCNGSLNRGHTLEVGRLAPNAWGLHDMHGNVWEWCWDYYIAQYYDVSPSQDPTGPILGNSRVARGGSWQNRARHCRSAFRGNFYPYSPDGYFGLRPVRWE